MTITCPRILIIDSYDSFTHNLASLCKSAVKDCRVHIIRNDALSLEQLMTVLPSFTAVVVGPGPGSPDSPSDVGIINELWGLPDSHVVPIFGVCLGLQSLALAFGAQLRTLKVVKHGQISRLQHNGTGLFQGLNDAYVVRYHSFHVQLEEGGVLEELAFADDGQENGHVVMAIRHVTRPFWAVQYHPESVCTKGAGVDVLHNFWRLANAWSTLNSRTQAPWTVVLEQIVGPHWPPFHVPRPSPPSLPPCIVHFATLDLPNFSVTKACERLGVRDELSPFILLHSASHPGRFSIICCMDDDTPRFLFTVGQPDVEVIRGTRTRCALGSLDVWSWLASFMHSHRARGGPLEVPFWGGLVGYLSYELGTAGLAPQLSPRKYGRRHPDINLAFVERSIVFDQYRKVLYIQTTRPNDMGWIERAKVIAVNSCEARKNDSIPRPIFSSSPVVHLPDEMLYKSRIQSAKERLFAGDSYELCLTAPTSITVNSILASPLSSSWEMYKLLQDKNPAPYSGYLRLSPTTLLSSSPERFLSFSRPPHSRCQLRPIKGTVQKGPGITRDIAERLLAGNNKEVAENLMIVDLIRHDLHGVVGDDVVVKHFCRVEEYETVWQLTSIIEGGPSPDFSLGVREEMGWRILQHSLPPGSMTGAPKKRSVEILHELEDSDRSLYSGVFGFWDVGGGGDWSVIIRSCFKYDGGHADGALTETKSDSSELFHEKWTIGAGGAITALSDSQAEWEEMCTKLKSVLQIFSAVQ
ncbi:ADC synthase [Vararia minispora EC-137]|uniref:ADC synthase n=1 Tax=Vararia minispora EC-137 TaxID=1314806 RepID=A0ACB8QID3_9AGAM|nr:ADC synthase [Vararia minispora EC-137]